MPLWKEPYSCKTLQQCNHQYGKSIVEIYYSLPITITFTISPLFICDKCSVFGGNTVRTWHERKLRSLLLIWRPVFSTQGILSEPSHFNTPLWYSGRGSRLTSEDSWKEYLVGAFNGRKWKWYSKRHISSGYPTRGMLKMFDQNGF